MLRPQRVRCLILLRRSPGKDLGAEIIAPSQGVKGSSGWESDESVSG